MPALPAAGRAFVALVAVLGIAVVGSGLEDLLQRPPDAEWYLLALLTCLGSLFAVRVPNASAVISVSEAFVFLAALIYGPGPSAVIIAIDGLVLSLRRRGRSLWQVLFNVTEPALSIFAAAHVFFLTGGHTPGELIRFSLSDDAVPLILFVLVYFAANAGLNTFMLFQQTHRPVWPVWRQHVGWMLLGNLVAASVAALLAYHSPTPDIGALIVVGPLLVLSYLTLKTSTARAEETAHHLEQLNRLYLSTIETLAMAIDAKDQITHGHIRRVQSYAVGLAKTLGVTDDAQLKAIEAAALLHDMGKLAVPEHILNKPGQLTPGEFEKMKTHATIGADLLSGIDFPYPVVPIVRHHHERWDGTGYPSGLRGADIPIGARILAVVDCFDALTSDRPYRKALAPDEAIAELQRMRGAAYDPLVVDTFIRIHGNLEPLETSETRREVFHHLVRRSMEVGDDEPRAGTGT